MSQERPVAKTCGIYGHFPNLLIYVFYLLYLFMPHLIQEAQESSHQFYKHLCPHGVHSISTKFIVAYSEEKAGREKGFKYKCVSSPQPSAAPSGVFLTHK